MKTFVRHAVALLAITAVCQAGLAFAEDYYAGSGGQTSLTGDQKAAPAPQTACAQCGQYNCCCGESYNPCDSCAGLGCDECPRYGLLGTLGFDSFKGISDENHESNFGVVTGVNFGAPLLGLADRGFGWQIGISYGIYDVDGRHETDPARSQTQTFVTSGLFRKAHGDRRLSYGIVYDWMYNDRWGVMANSPTLGQWRGQIEYALSGCNAVGVWGCQRDRGSVQRTVTQLTVTDRALSQANVFWHHKFESGADSWLWLGVPERGRIDAVQGGSLGDWTLGANVQVPLSDRFALYGNASYMHPSAAAGTVAAAEQGYDVGMGVVWYFGRNAVSHAINHKCWTPYLPMANNSNFLVDENVTH
jgi:hypothetical protein